MDKISASLRSENMRRIRSTNTRPEIIVRKIVYRLGFRYRLHVSNLPGKPDLVFRSRKKVIFIHGCFWHQHPACPEGRIPKSRKSYWVKKLAHNVARDRQHLASLAGEGWRSLVLWECELGDESRVVKRLRRFLGSVVPPNRTS